MHKKQTKRLTALFAAVLLLAASCGLLAAPAAALGATPTGSASAFVYIRGVFSGQYIDVPGGTVANGKALQMYKGNETAAQKWEVYTYSNGWSIIRSAVDQRYVFSVQSAGNGARLVLEYVDYGATVPQRALFCIVSADWYGVAGIYSKLAMDAGAWRPLEELGNGIIHQYDEGLSVPLDDLSTHLWVFESTSRVSATLSWDLVDSGGHSDWDGTSKYKTLVETATERWNTYMVKTRFRKKTILNLRDFAISDLASDPTLGYAIARTYSDGRIEFYRDMMDGTALPPNQPLDSKLERHKTVMHELGHALGLNENNNRGNVMSQGHLAYSYQISLDDKFSYQNKNY